MDNEKKELLEKALKDAGEIADARRIHSYQIERSMIGDIEDTLVIAIKINYYPRSNPSE